MSNEDVARAILARLAHAGHLVPPTDGSDEAMVALVASVLGWAPTHAWSPPPGWTAEEVGDEPPTIPAWHGRTLGTIGKHDALVGNPNGITGHRSEDTAVIIDDPPWTPEREAVWDKWRNRTGSVVPPADDPDTRDAAQIRALGESMVTDLWGGVAQSALIAEGMKNPDRWLNYDVDGFLAGHRALLYEAKRDGRMADAEALVQQLREVADRARSPEMADRLRRHAETSAAFLAPREAIDPDVAAAEMADALLHPWQVDGRKP